MEPHNVTKQITNAVQVRRYLEDLSASDKLLLIFEGGDSELWPIVRLAMNSNDTLLIDLEEHNGIQDQFTKGAMFRLVGEADGAMVRTNQLTAFNSSFTVRDNQLSSSYPHSLEITFRREAFRAELLQNMIVPVEIVTPELEQTLPATLKNLPVGGCLLEGSMYGAIELLRTTSPVTMTGYFPNGEQMHVQAIARHGRPNKQWTAASLGFQFDAMGKTLERQLWYFTKEVEKHNEFLRNKESNVDAPPSQLFEHSNGQAKQDQQHNGSDYNKNHVQLTVEAMAVRLEGHLVRLLNGQSIKFGPILDLSRHLIRLILEDRDRLLSSLKRLHNYHDVVQHGLAVAVHLACLCNEYQIETIRLNDFVACALVHDFGKITLPKSITESTSPLTPEQRVNLSSHVTHIMDHLDNEQTLISNDTIDAIIKQCNERLDGSGYPNALTDEGLPELARIMAVIDVADAMQRDRADRSAHSKLATHQHLITARDKLDPTWTKRYTDFFESINEVPLQP